MEKMNVYATPGLKNTRTPYQVFKDVCGEYEETAESVLKNIKSRKRVFSEIRNITMYLFILKFNYTYKKAASFFGKDHATAHHARKQVENLFETDKEFRERLNRVI